MISTHPRQLTTIARRPDTARKDAREARRIRKAEEKLKREEEKKQLKNQKKKEIERKLALLGLGKDGRSKDGFGKIVFAFVGCANTGTAFSFLS